MPGIKRSIKSALITGGRMAARRRGQNRVAVLCYHSVHPSKRYASATPEAFEDHIRWLTQHCDVVPVGDVVGARRSGSDRPAVAVTFDDGYRDNYDFVFPVLKKYGIPCTIFLTTGFLNRDPEIMERLDTVWRIPQGEVEPMTWEQVREMHDYGVEFGAHTVGHPNLALFDRAAVRDELMVSRLVIEEVLGAPVRGCSYPFGKYQRHYTDETVDVVRDLDFEYALAVSFRRVKPSDSCFRIPRFYVDHDSVADLHDKVAGAWDLVGNLQESVPPSVARIVSPIDFSF